MSPPTTANIVTNTILFRTDLPAYTYLLYLIYVLFLLDHTHAAGINGIPITKDIGYTADISPLLRLSFDNQYITR